MQTINRRPMAIPSKELSTLIPSKGVLLVGNAHSAHPLPVRLK